MTSNAASYTPKNATGPDATPKFLSTGSPFGRSREKLNPVPEPRWWIDAASSNVPKIPFIESSTGKTKQELSCCVFVPAFIKVGELGKNRNCAIMVKKRSSMVLRYETP